MSIFYFMLIAIANLGIGFYAARFLNYSAPGPWANYYSTDRIPTDPAEATSEAIASPSVSKVPEQPAVAEQPVEEASVSEEEEAGAEEKATSEVATEEKAVAKEAVNATPPEAEQTPEAESDIGETPATEEAGKETEETQPVEESDEVAGEESSNEDEDATDESTGTEIAEETNNEDTNEEEAVDAKGDSEKKPVLEMDETEPQTGNSDAPGKETNGTTETPSAQEENPDDLKEKLSDDAESEGVEDETSALKEESSEKLESDSTEQETQPSHEEEAGAQPKAQQDTTTKAEALAEPAADSDKTNEADSVSGDSSSESQDDLADPADNSSKQDQNCPAYFLSKLMTSSSKWTQEIKQADAEIRRGLENGSTDHLADCFARLENFTEHTLQQISPELERLVSLENLKPEVKSTVSEIRSSFDRVITDSQSTVELLRKSNFSSAPEDSGHQGAFPKALAALSDLFSTTSETRDQIGLAHSRFSDIEDSSESAENGCATDELTGIPTVSAAWAKLDELWKPNSPRPESVAVGIIDVDQQKTLNSNFGILANDALIIAIAHSAAVAVVGQQMAVRYSGQRFLFVLPETSVEEATEIVERIRQTIEANRYRYREQHLPITVSAAIARDDLSGSPDDLLERATLALKEAKSQGGNRTFLHEGSSILPIEAPSMGIAGNEVELE